MALLDEDAGDIGVVSLECPDGRYPSVGLLHPPALRLERAAADLFGLMPEGLPDTRPWLDHGQWGISHPLGAAEPASRAGTLPIVFLPAEGESLHQIPVGPVHAGIIEPGHFRFTRKRRNGRSTGGAARLRSQGHRGPDGGRRHRSCRQARRPEPPVTAPWRMRLPLPARSKRRWVSRRRTRAVWLRALMAELERLANHLGDIGAICNDAAFALMHAHCGVLRERVLRASRCRLRPSSDARPHRARRDRRRPAR